MHLTKSCSSTFRIFVVSIVLVWSALPTTAKAQSAKNDFVSRSEYDALKRELSELRGQLTADRGAGNVDGKNAAVSANQRTTIPPLSTVGIQSAASNSTFEESLKDLRTTVDGLRGGSTQSMITGGASAGFIEPKVGKSNFGATFSPIFLWNINDNLLFEGEVEFELADSQTETKLEYAHIIYSVNDYLSIGAGKFLNPVNTFVERYEPKWINKLPDTPLAIYDSLMPESEVGVQARAVIPTSAGKLLYTMFISNGPTLNNGPDDAGTLAFDNFQDSNNNKAIGGRLGYLPIPGLELGYGLEDGTTSTADQNISGANFLLQSTDFDYSREMPSLLGRINFRGQYVWSRIERATYSLDGNDASFANNRDGGYLQASYRPTRVAPIKDFEFIGRYDQINQPTDAPGAYDENRVTFGLDYWLDPRVAVKAAYEIDSVKNGPDDNRFLLQLAAGLY